MATKAKQTVKPVTKSKIPANPPIKDYFGLCNGDSFGITDHSDDNIPYTTLFYADLRTLEHCCGVIEIGDITSSTSTFGKPLENALDEAVVAVLNKFTQVKRCNTLVANLVKNRACERLRASFIRTGLFTLVKTFVNTGSGNQIEMWVSNN